MYFCSQIANNMEIKYITDTDFIKERLEGDEYSLIYGIIQHSTHNTELRDKYIYNLTVVLCLKQETRLLRIVKVKQWIALVEKIVGLLQTYGKGTLVTIPFCNIYGYEIDEVINSFQLSLSLLQELLVSNFENMEVIEYIYRCYPIQSLEELFFNLVIEIDSGIFEGMDSTDSYIVYDEMIRRGLNVDKRVISPSEHYNDNLYYKRFIGATKPKMNIIEDYSETDYEVVKYKGYDIERIGVIYYMLRDALKDNQELLIKVANYAIDKDYILQNRANNAAYKYIHTPTLLIDKVQKIEKICKQLERYGIEIPNELQLEKKELTKFT